MADGCVCLFVCMYVCLTVRVNEWKCWNPIGVAQIPCRLPGDWLQLVCRHRVPRVGDIECVDIYALSHTFCWLAICPCRPHLISFFPLVTLCFQFKQHRWIISKWNLVVFVWVCHSEKPVMVKKQQHKNTFLNDKEDECSYRTLTFLC